MQNNHSLVEIVVQKIFLLSAGRMAITNVSTAGRDGKIPIAKVLRYL